jgi:hypothetical protein
MALYTKEYIMEKLPFTLNSLLTAEPPEEKSDNLPTPTTADTSARETPPLNIAVRIEMTLRNMRALRKGCSEGN